MQEPLLDAAPWVHPSAVVLGNVALGAAVSVWPCAVLRGDSDRITVGVGSNVQDGAILHVDPGVPCTVGARCTIGHRAVVHGCTVEDEVLVGMGAIILNRAVIGAGSIIGAGALIPEGMIVPASSLVLGVPGRIVRAVRADERAAQVAGALRYVQRAAEHARGAYLPWGTGVRVPGSRA
jgi:carbonic anhydrase/acetyltransferase-like protein (isoleucine patch superfamily)